MRPDIPPDHILQIGMGFWASKTLLSAVELGLFTQLADRPMTGPELEKALELHPRATYDFLDALVSLRLLEREGAGADGRYSNTPATALYLDRHSPQYIGGILEMAGARLFRFWADLTPALKTGKPQNEVKISGRSMFDSLYADPARLEQFMDAMSGVSMANFEAFARSFDFSRYRTLVDIGGATGQLSCFVAGHQPHMRCASYDLPVVQPIAECRIREAGLRGRVTAGSIDFFEDDFPRADVITMGMILHDWNLDAKKMLIGKAYQALPPGGAFVAIENIIDDERRQNIFGLLMSLNMLIEFGEAFDFTGADFRQWCLEAGFARCEILPLAGPASAAIAYK
ncbi:methyltransferase [Sphingomonadales bacterium 56]|uniref:acetylserotonin O-methyltransferase n=1 Tax=unclassified Sphingobium TaxID=2611147 RepID=UPI001A15E133|nr:MULTISPECIES: acetylserotonin O-methyltransferase [unclassified Sphingobium]MBY2927944.1 methyltransferase [Sphingomonadales bacterium 56]MBY2958044.1 methyltransferase [Sphingomonadales bacterium 58]CAD7336254.1 N,N-dimethyltransferase OxyT [Sphingobium sp. S6]CAD7336315.1 N,N-dimethyltransferase OxyT [Sphingobium sp. S8]